MTLIRSMLVASTLALGAIALASCEGNAKLEPCNVAELSCQEDIYYALVRLRGDGYDPLAGIPPIRTITLEQYRREVLGDRADDVDDDDDAGVSDDDGGMPDGDDDDDDEPTPVDPWDVALKLLGLIPKQTSAGQASANNQINNVAAYYSSRTQQVTVIDRGNARDDFADTQLLLHELVHALQDREFSSTLSDGTTDGSIAARALTEGEATFYEYLANAEMRDIPLETAGWQEFYERWIANGRDRLSMTEAPFYGVRWLVYPLGGYYLVSAWQRGGNAAVRHAYAEPRRTIAQYVTGYREESFADPDALRCEVTPPSESYELRGLDRFGALQVFGFLTAAGAPAGESWGFVKRWVDDRLYVYLEPEDETVLVTWRIRFADEVTAEQARDALSEALSVRVETRRSDLLLTGGSDPEVAASWPGASRCD